MSTKIIPPDVCERDVDFLLLEEAVASPAFLRWFLVRIGIKRKASLVEAARSVKTETGESDLELTVKTRAGPVRILVENKVGASFTPDQPQRYRARAEAYRGRGTYRHVVTVLMAPESYFGDLAS